jgi:TonB-dependent receptor
LETVDDGFREYNLLNQGYVLEYMPAPEMMQDFYNFYPQFFIFDRTATKIKTYGEDYDAHEDVYAAYIMAQHNFNRLMLLGGVRYEQTNVDYQGMNIITEKGKYKDMDTLYDKRTHQFILPQIQARYAFRENLNLRAAVTYTYSRPNFVDVLPFREEDYDEVTYGNPDLEYPTSLNVDLMTEFYHARGKGFFSGGLFYKSIDNFVFYYKRFAHEGDPEDYGLVEITKAVNGNDADVFGAELNAQFKFWFFNGLIHTPTHTLTSAIQLIILMPS